MQNDWCMRPALQKSEAVLLPALPRTAAGGFRFSHSFPRISISDDPFRPLPETETTALSTYVRPRGSMAGRGVLRAVGVNAAPFAHRPAYAGCMRTSLRRTLRR